MLTFGRVEVRRSGSFLVDAGHAPTRVPRVPTVVSLGKVSARNQTEGQSPVISWKRWIRVNYYCDDNDNDDENNVNENSKHHNKYQDDDNDITLRKI